jgi:hypothetical protein
MLGSAKKLRTAFLLLLALAAAGPARAPASAADAVARPPLGTPELAGLRASLTSIGWTGDGSLSVEYSLQWIDPANAWVLDSPEAPINVSYWDTGSQPPKALSVELALIVLPDDFLDRTAQRASASIVTQVPPGATAVSFALGASGLETEPIPLPPR